MSVGGGDAAQSAQRARRRQARQIVAEYHEPLAAAEAAPGLPADPVWRAAARPPKRLAVTRVSY
jgi:hypothetical protein